MSMIGAINLSFFEIFQSVEDFRTEKLHLVEEIGQFGDGWRAWNAPYDGHISVLDRQPVAVRTFFDGSRDQLAHVAAADGQVLLGLAEGSTLGHHLLCHDGQFLGPRQKRRKIETESAFDRA